MHRGAGAEEEDEHGAEGGTHAVILPAMILRAFALAASLASLPACADFTARKVLEAWLDAFNSFDAAKLAAYDAAHAPPQKVAQLGGFRFMTGGFTVVSFEVDQPLTVTALLQEANSDTLAKAVLFLDDEKSGKVTNFNVRLVQRPPDLAIKRVGAEEAIALTASRTDALASHDVFSGVLLVAKGDKVVLEKMAGYADRDARKPITADTQFRIGSMNKMFTSVAILQLADEGKLSLDDAVGKHLASYPEKDVAAKVTIRQLLAHTGGTGDIFGPEFVKNRLALRTLDDYARLYGTRPLDQPPGSGFKYSNYGYILLGLIIEKASGQSYYDYVESRIYKPAGMKSTASLPETDAVPNRSVGYMMRDGKWIPNTETLPWRGTSAGGGYSTAGDLLRFAQALESGKLVSKAALAEATVPVSGTYALGFSVRGEGMLRRYSHGGGAPGMNGMLNVYPETGYIVVSLCNLDPPTAERLPDFLDRRLPEK